mmetsp:Transcript_6177/g.15233  ORF Transcript_6177/g.15233 Transcript_6177/m.15233 type:complete len:217 (-) Transcript_6177:269-919(-)
MGPAPKPVTKVCRGPLQLLVNAQLQVVRLPPLRFHRRRRLLPGASARIQATRCRRCVPLGELGRFPRPLRLFPSPFDGLPLPCWRRLIHVRMDSPLQAVPALPAWPPGTSRPRFTALRWPLPLSTGLCKLADELKLGSERLFKSRDDRVHLGHLTLQLLELVAVRDQGLAGRRVHALQRRELELQIPPCDPLLHAGLAELPAHSIDSMPHGSRFRF